MELYTEDLSGMADITAAVLEERTNGEGVLRLEFAGFGPDWLEYMEPVTLYHKGKVIFHGKLVRVSRTNAGGVETASAEGQNFMWLLERQTLGQQLAELEAAVGGSGTGNEGEVLSQASLFMRRLGRGQVGKMQAEKVPGAGYRVNWRNAVLPLRMSAPGWRVKTVAARAVEEDDELRVEASPGIGERQVWAVTEATVTTASALWRLKRTAPDAQFLVDYAVGTVTAFALGELPELTLDTGSGAVLRVSDIEPQYEAAVTGVAIAYTDDGGATELHTYPTELDVAQDGVKVFQLTGRYYVESWDLVAQEYYQAANELQWSGTVDVLAAALEESPLGRRLCLTGAGTHESWWSMRAVVTSCSWDLREGIVTLGLGRDFADPEFADAAETYDGGDPVEEFERNMSGEAGDGFPWLPNESDEGGGGGGSGSAESRYRVEDATASYGATAVPGRDDWEQTFYLQGSYQNGSMQYVQYDRQLMRFRESSGKVVLQVVAQKSYDGTLWQPQ